MGKPYEQSGLIRFYQGHRGRLWQRCIGATQQLAHEDIYMWHNRTPYWICFPYSVPGGAWRYSYLQRCSASTHAQVYKIWLVLTNDERFSWIAQEKGRPILGNNLFAQWYRKRAGFGKLPFGSIDVPWSYWINSKLPKKGFCRDSFGATAFGSPKPIYYYGYDAKELTSSARRSVRGFGKSEFAARPFGNPTPFWTLFFGFGSPEPNLIRFGFGVTKFGYCYFGSPKPVRENWG